MQVSGLILLLNCCADLIKTFNVIKSPPWSGIWKYYAMHSFLSWSVIYPSTQDQTL